MRLRELPEAVEAARPRSKTWAAAGSPRSEQSARLLATRQEEGPEEGQATELR